MKRQLSILFLLLICTPFIRAAEPAPKEIGDIQFESETLDNGLRVIYAPLSTAPVVDVRVLYHVGSRDERPDRQGFAHMFEHMMFRGSAHVEPEEHMKLVGGVGGISNAFTSFDQTVYWQTLPASHLEMALYLEADRMASFKVSDAIYKTERNVVAEEWRTRQNRPYGTVYDELFKTVFTKHSYRWTPIGDMDNLRAAPSSELQEFFNKYYIPNNAILVVAGDIDVAKSKEMVHKYFGWIPRGPDIKREIPVEPEQTQPRRLVSPQAVPLPAIVVAHQLPAYGGPDEMAIDMLASILGDGRSSRLDSKLVYNPKPLAVESSASAMDMQDGGVLAISATVLQGKNVADVEKEIDDVIKQTLANGVTNDELNKAKSQARVAILRSRDTATEIASSLGTEALLTNDPNRVNTELERLSKVTVADVNRVAKKYLDPQTSTVLLVKPDPLGTSVRASTTQAAALATAPVAASTEPVKPRDVTFPTDYPKSPPTATIATARAFEKGTEFDLNGVRVIVMSDHRLPLVNWSLTIRRGGYAISPDKVGVAGLTASLLQRGTKPQTFSEFSSDLESRGITLDVSDGGDVTSIVGSSTTDQLSHAFDRTREMLTEPRLDASEFDRLKTQSLSALQLDLERPATVASREFLSVLYGQSPLGRAATPDSVSSVTLDDVKSYYAATYVPQGSILVIAGDVTVEEGKAQAERLLKGWADGRIGMPKPLDYSPDEAAKARAVLVDRPEAKGATVRFGGLAYDIHTDEKYAGAVVNRILSGGINARMMKYVRAEKGLVYSAGGIFSPSRHGGEFVASADMSNDNVVPAIEAMFTVLQNMRDKNVTDEELAEAKQRVAGGMLMQLQTLAAQAQYRVDGILNDYPIDYYDTYPQRVAQVTADEVRALMQKYTDPDKLHVIVVAPAAAVEGKLKTLGTVKVVPMPNKRSATTKPANPEMLKPAA